MHEILESICHISLQNSFEAEPENQKMTYDNSFNAMILKKLVQKTYNDSTKSIVNDVTGNGVEAMYLLLLVSGNDFFFKVPRSLHTEE